MHYDHTSWPLSNFESIHGPCFMFPSTVSISSLQTCIAFSLLVIWTHSFLPSLTLVFFDFIPKNIQILSVLYPLSRWDICLHSCVYLSLHCKRFMVVVFKLLFFFFFVSIRNLGLMLWPSLLMFSVSNEIHLGFGE